MKQKALVPNAHSKPQRFLALYTLGMLALLVGLGMCMEPPRPLLERMGVQRTGTNGAELFIDAVDLITQKQHAEATRWLRNLNDEPTDPPYGLAPNVSRTTVRQRITEVVLRAHPKVVEGNRLGFAPLRRHQGPETLFPELSEFRTATHAVSAAIHELYARGDGKLATELLREWTLALDQYPNRNLITFLVQVACHSILLARVEPLLRNISRTDAQTLLNMRVPMLNDPSFLGKVFAGEYEFMRAYSESPEVKEYFSEKSPPPSPELIREALALCQRHTENFRLLFEQPEITWYQGALALDEALEIQGRDDAAAALAVSFIPPGSNVVQTFLRIRTQWRLFRLAARAQLFSWENERLPAVLSDFVPEDERTDPINGKPFVYRPLSHWFELESEGLPGKGPITLRTRQMRELRNDSP